MNGLIATPEQIIELTGYKQPFKQEGWLRQEGFIFRIGGDGKIKLHISEIESKMISCNKSKKRKPELNIEDIVNG